MPVVTAETDVRKKCIFYKLQVINNFVFSEIWQDFIGFYGFSLISSDFHYSCLPIIVFENNSKLTSPQKGNPIKTCPFSHHLLACHVLTMREDPRQEAIQIHRKSSWAVFWSKPDISMISWSIHVLVIHPSLSAHLASWNISWCGCAKSGNQPGWSTDKCLISPWVLDWFWSGWYPHYLKAILHL